MPVANAAVFYVRESGNDAADGRTRATAFATITRAAQAVQNAGDEVIVGPGTYAEGRISPARNGIAAREIRFVADASGAATGDPPGPVTIEVPGGERAAFLLLGRRFVTVEGFVIVGGLDAGIRVRPQPGGEPSSDITVRGNTVANSAGNGIDVEADGEVRVEENTVADQAKTGIKLLGSGTAVVRGNTVLRNGGSGISVEVSGTEPRVEVSGNTAGSNAAHGIFVRGNGTAAVVVQNNGAFTNRATGITLRGVRAPLVVNNLVYANAEDGIAVGTGDLASPDAVILNNTVYSNSGWGLRIGTAVVPSPNALVLNNIFWANGKGGVAVGTSSTCGYVAGFNVHPRDSYGPKTPFNEYDIGEAPQFTNPAGPDGVLGGDGFADDDFHLAQRQAGDPVDSPGVDGGFGTAAEIGLGGSTATSGAPDMGPIDAGFHYGADAGQGIRVPDPFMPVYVRQGGAGGNSGKSPEVALDSIQSAARKARAGGTVIVGPGVYREGNIHPIQDGGVTRFVADASGSLTGDPPGPVLLDAEGAGTGFVLLRACKAVVDGFRVTGALTAGIQVRLGSDGARIRNNLVSSNRRVGIDVKDADDVVVFNNLVFGNGTGGIQVGGQGGARRTLIRSNTCAANGLVGILIGSGAGASPCARVEYNIVYGNGDNGIQVGSGARAELSLLGYEAAFNLNADGYGAGTPRPDSDLACASTSDPACNPLFVEPAAGDFHLSQTGAGQEETSPAVDFAPISPAAVGLEDRSTRTDGLPDRGWLDLGFHYGTSETAPHLFEERDASGSGLPDFCFVPRGDADGDGAVESPDIASLIRELFDGDGDAAASARGGLNPGASGSDGNGDGRVTAADLVWLLRFLATPM